MDQPHRQFQLFDVFVVALVVVALSYLLGSIWSIYRVNTVTPIMIREAQFLLGIVVLLIWTVREAGNRPRAASSKQNRKGLFGRVNKFADELEAEGAEPDERAKQVKRTDRSKHTGAIEQTAGNSRVTDARDGSGGPGRNESVGRATGAKLPGIKRRIGLYRRVTGDDSPTRRDGPGMNAHLLIAGLILLGLSIGVELLR